MSEYPILSIATFLPTAGAVLVWLARSDRLARWISLLTTLVTLLVCVPLYTQFDPGTSALQFVESANWIEAWGITYGMGLDGISMPFVLLAALLSVLCVGVSWTAVQSRVRGFHVALLVTETAMIGLFCATNLLLFFVFWELIVVPMFLLIGIWGGKRRVASAIKFLLFTLTGSVLMLVGMIVIYDSCGSLDFVTLREAGIPAKQQAWLFGAFLAAFAVKVPMFPVHTWLPDAHTEAPTAGSVLLAGVLLKMGAYGLLRVSLPLFPQAVVQFLTPLLVLSVVAIVYGAYVTLMQTDIKRLIAYSSVSHMGFVTLGIFTLDPVGVEGAILQMVNHGILSAALFLCVGMIYERTHTREIADYGGVARRAPIYASLFAFFCLAATGFPGLNSFVGELLIIGAAFRTGAWWGALAIWGVLLGTIYLVWLFYRVIMGPTHKGLEGLKLELNSREVAILAPLALLALVLGLAPDFVLSGLHASVNELLSPELLNAGGRP
ncbi:MAG: NADH-quinone oxidoreductase subunit M [bacterium]|nr:NADH-quinone oxidoreductase subunit M [Planctomycetota bacterium]